jgi:hypothetical protein
MGVYDAYNEYMRRREAGSSGPSSNLEAQQAGPVEDVYAPYKAYVSRQAAQAELDARDNAALDARKEELRRQQLGDEGMLETIGRQFAPFGGDLVSGAGHLVAGLGQAAGYVDRALTPALPDDGNVIQDWADSVGRSADEFGEMIRRQSADENGELNTFQNTVGALGSMTPNLLASLGIGAATGGGGLIASYLNPAAMVYRTTASSLGEAAGVRRELQDNGASDAEAVRQSDYAMLAGLLLNGITESAVPAIARGIRGAGSPISNVISGWLGSAAMEPVQETGEGVIERGSGLLNADGSPVTVDQYIQNLGITLATEGGQIAGETALPSFLASLITGGLGAGADITNIQVDRALRGRLAADDAINLMEIGNAEKNAQTSSALGELIEQTQSLRQAPQVEQGLDAYGQQQATPEQVMQSDPFGIDTTPKNQTPAAQEAVTELDNRTQQAAADAIVAEEMVNAAVQQPVVETAPQQPVVGRRDAAMNWAQQELDRLTEGATYDAEGNLAQPMDDETAARYATVARARAQGDLATLESLQQPESVQTEQIDPPESVSQNRSNARWAAQRSEFGLNDDQLYNIRRSVDLAVSEEQAIQSVTRKHPELAPEQIDKAVRTLWARADERDARAESQRAPVSEGPTVVGRTADGKELMFNQKAFNGGPEDFDSDFSTDYIGTGQGEAVHGWGLYFSSGGKVSESYRRTYSRPTNVESIGGRAIAPDVQAVIAKAMKLTPDNVGHLQNDRVQFTDSQWVRRAINGGLARSSPQLMELAKNNADRNYLRRALDIARAEKRSVDTLADFTALLDDARLNTGEADTKSKATIMKRAKPELFGTLTPEEKQVLLDLRKQIDAGGKVKMVGGGQLYEVDIPENNDLLFEDGDYNSQSDNIKKRLQDFANSTPDTTNAPSKTSLFRLNGEDIYDGDLAEFAKGNNSQRAIVQAIEMLRSAGEAINAKNIRDTMSAMEQDARDIGDEDTADDFLFGSEYFEQFGEDADPVEGTRASSLMSSAKARDVVQRFIDDRHVKGDDLYNNLKGIARMEGLEGKAAELVSRFFSELGVPGLRYTGETVWSGNRHGIDNFVIWDDSTVKKIRKFFQEGKTEQAKSMTMKAKARKSLELDTTIYKDAIAKLNKAGIEGVEAQIAARLYSRAFENFGNLYGVDGDQLWTDLGIDFSSEDLTDADGTQHRGGMAYTTDENGVANRMRVIFDVKNADTTTTFHEMFHVFHEMVKRGAYTTDSQVLKDAWFAMEKFAQGDFEKIANAGMNYVMKGDVKDSAIRKVFNQFKAWLQNLWSTFTGEEKQEFNPELREFFDSLLASDSGFDGLYTEDNPRISNVASNPLSDVRKKANKKSRPVDDNSLMAIREVSPRGLLKILEDGVDAAPSVGIVNRKSPKTGFGPISMIMGKDTINPDLDSRNHVYYGDGWTPMAIKTPWTEDYGPDDEARDLEKKMDAQAKMRAARGKEPKGRARTMEEVQARRGDQIGKGGLHKIGDPYDEAKPFRGVGNREILGVVIPASADQEIRDALDKAGITYRTYVGAQNRDAAVTGLADTLDQEQVYFQDKRETTKKGNISTTTVTKDLSDVVNPLRHVNSPSVLAKLYIKFAPVFDQGTAAMRSQRELKAQYQHAIDKVFGKPGLTGRTGGICQTAEDREGAHIALITGDMYSKELSDQELNDMGITSNAIKAYKRMRQIYKNLGAKLNAQRKKYGKGEFALREGYVPHIFHHWTVYDDSNTVVRSFDTLAEATKYAESIAKDNKEIKIKPLMQDFGGQAKQDAVTVGDMQYYKLVSNVSNVFALSREEAKDFASEVGRMSNKSRWFGNAQHREGFSGYDVDMEFAARHYANMAARYIAMDDFKHNAMRYFERTFGKFDRRHQGIAAYTQDYINDVLGKPTAWEQAENKLIMGLPFADRWVPTDMKDRPAVALGRAWLGTVATMKLGLGNIGSALVNLSSLNGVAAKVGYKHTTAAIGEYTSNLNSPKLEIQKLYSELGLGDDLTQASASAYSKATDYRRNVAKVLGQASTGLYTAMDGAARKLAAIAGYRKALADGKTRAQAIAYAREVVDQTNFNYGIEDTPNIMRRTGTAGAIALQFKKYPIKAWELGMNHLEGMERVKYWGGMLVLGGLVGGIPLFGVISAAAKALFPEDDLELEIKRVVTALPLPVAVQRTLLYGALSNLGIDISSRVGLGDAVSSLGGPTVSTLQQIAQGIPKVFAGADGAWWDLIGALAPGLANPGKAIAGQSEDARTGRLKTKYTPAERAARALGFTPIRESVETDAMRLVNYDQVGVSAAQKAAMQAYAQDPSNANRDRLRKEGVTPQQLLRFMKALKRPGSRYEQAIQDASKRSTVDRLVDYGRLR